MHENLEFGYCKDILARLAIHQDGMPFEALKDSIGELGGSKKNFETTFNKSLLAVLIHAPFDLRTLGTVKTIVRAIPEPTTAASDSTTAVTVRSIGIRETETTLNVPLASTPAAGGASALGLGRDAASAGLSDDGDGNNQLQLTRAAILQELPLGTTKIESELMADVKARPEIIDLRMNTPIYAAVFDGAISRFTMEGANKKIDVIEPSGAGGEESYKRVAS